MGEGERERIRETGMPFFHYETFPISFRDKGKKQLEKHDDVKESEEAFFDCSS